MSRIHLPPALLYPPFRYLWLALIISTAGANMQLWALFWHVRTLTPHPIALGGIGLVRILPVIFFSLIGGVAADRYNRRTIFFAAQCVLTVVAGMLAWLTLRDSITLWHIYALTALQATASAFDIPARQALVPNLVLPKDLPNAFSLSSIAFQVGAIVGPALGGWTIAVWGQAYPYLINAISYGAVLLAIWRMGEVPQRRIVTQRKLFDWQAMREGWLFILGQPLIFASMLLDFFATFFSSANTLMPIVARDILRVGEIEYGWLSSAQAIGAVLAGLVVSQLGEVRHQGEGSSAPPRPLGEGLGVRVFLPLLCQFRFLFCIPHPQPNRGFAHPSFARPASVSTYCSASSFKNPPAASSRRLLRTR